MSTLTHDETCTEGVQALLDEIAFHRAQLAELQARSDALCASLGLAYVDLAYARAVESAIAVQTQSEG